ncbi:MAG: 16S rRNA (cytosine(1402)-N(4))-methyltransferase RsmH, partial [Candidatus Phytoplasma australasiaticum]|nr:16S rRNA (cytosine(1402)-N(4))-methyltransferase RsmH [Candidatus Phytoplasma australasiaticum]
FDQDKKAIQKAKLFFKKEKKINIIYSNFYFLKKELNKKGIKQIDGIIFDLGLSSFQIDNEKRGFSYLSKNNLDMRMDIDQQILTAKDIINKYSYENLKKIFFIYGEEKKSSLIAKEIIRKRPIQNSLELVEIIDKFKKNKKGHSAKKIFQALRIEVNQELIILKEAIKQSFDLLKKNARIIIISFNSLEDRIVKKIFKKYSSSNFPKKLITFDKFIPILKIINKKIITPQIEEILSNPRSKSAKLRIAEKNI